MGQEQRHKDRHEPNCTVNLTAASSGNFLFFRVAAAVVFDVSRIQTFHSVLKVSTERIVLMFFDCNRLHLMTHFSTNQKETNLLHYFSDCLSPCSKIHVLLYSG